MLIYKFLIAKRKIFSCWTVHCCDKNYSTDLAKNDRNHLTECISPTGEKQRENKTSANFTISFFLNLLFMLFVFPWLSLPLLRLFFLYVLGQEQGRLVCMLKGIHHLLISLWLSGSELVPESSQIVGELISVLLIQASSYVSHKFIKAQWKTVLLVCWLWRQNLSS